MVSPSYSFLAVRTYFFSCSSFTSFLSSHPSSFLTFYWIFILFHSCCSHVWVFRKTLMPEFHISYSHTEWCLLFSDSTYTSAHFVFRVKKYEQSSTSKPVPLNLTKAHTSMHSQVLITVGPLDVVHHGYQMCSVQSIPNFHCVWFWKKNAKSMFGHTIVGCDGKSYFILTLIF